MESIIADAGFHISKLRLRFNQFSSFYILHCATLYGGWRMSGGFAKAQQSAYCVA
jgi:hypothetical protein